MAIPTSRQATRDIFLLILGAALYTIASPPYEWASAAWLALTPLFLVLQEKTPRTAFLYGLFYGVLFCAGIAYWVYFAIAAYFPFFFPLDLLLTFLAYSVFVGSYTGLVAALSCVLLRSGRPMLCCSSIPALWVSSEFARSSLLSGFSWELLGYTQYRHLTLIQIADITGVYGLSFLIALSGYMTAEILVSLCRWTAGECNGKFPWTTLGFWVGGIILILLYGTVRLRDYQTVPSAPSVAVAVVEGDVPSEQRWQRGHYTNTLLKYIAVTRRSIEKVQPDLIVWPEFAVGFYLDRESLLRSQLGWLTRQSKAFLLVGAPRMEESESGKRYYNSAYLMSPDGKLLDIYDKIRLLPFAEYRPLALPALVNHNPEHPSEFTAGQHSTVFSLSTSTFGVMICYEATYPDLARRLVQGGAQFLINISNDTWLVEAGRAAAAQHFSMVVFRAVETKRALVRVATAGISGFIDPTGRLYRLSGKEEGAVLGKVFPRQELTVYARYGDWFAFACAGFALVALKKARQKQVGARQFL